MIAVDAGNTRIKFGYFAGNTLLGVAVAQAEKFDPSNIFLSRLQFNSCNATVVQQSFGLAAQQQHWCLAPTGCRFDAEEFQTQIRKHRSDDTVKILKNADVPIRVRSDASDPSCIGLDRLLGAFAALARKTDKRILVADAGSAITIDFVESNVYQGGATLPGFRFLAETFPKISTALPLISSQETCEMDIPPFPCKNTDESLKAGIYWTVIGAIRQFDAMSYPDYVFLTGGDSAILYHGLLDFADKDRLILAPELVLEGIALCQ